MLQGTGADAGLSRRNLPGRPGLSGKGVDDATRMVAGAST